MKKNHFLSSILLMAVITGLFLACQKDQDAVSTEKQAAAPANENVQLIAVDAKNVHGFISQDAANAMRTAFVRDFASKTNSRYVAFSVKDLAGYLSTATNRYKSDSIYVNFGVYTPETAHSQGLSGQLTVFFMAKNKFTKTGNISSQEEAADGSSNYLNMGSLCCPKNPPPPPQ